MWRLVAMIVVPSLPRTTRLPDCRRRDQSTASATPVPSPVQCPRSRDPSAPRSHSPHCTLTAPPPAAADTAPPSPRSLAKGEWTVHLWALGDAAPLPPGLSRCVDDRQSGPKRPHRGRPPPHSNRRSSSKALGSAAALPPTRPTSHGDHGASYAAAAAALCRSPIVLASESAERPRPDCRATTLLLLCSQCRRQRCYSGAHLPADTGDLHHPALTPSSIDSLRAEAACHCQAQGDRSTRMRRGHGGGQGRLLGCRTGESAG